MKIIRESLEEAPDLAILGGAPSANRTPDLLLRRSFRACLWLSCPGRGPMAAQWP